MLLIRNEIQVEIPRMKNSSTSISLKFTRVVASSRSKIDVKKSEELFQQYTVAGISIDE